MNELKQYAVEFEEMERRDQAAKAAGTLVGRYTRVSVADNYAYYVITRVHEQVGMVDTVCMSNIGYVSDIVEAYNGAMPLALAERDITFRDNWDAMVEARGKE